MSENNKPRLNILFLARELSYRGASIYTLNLAEGLQQQGHKVKVICGGGILVNEFVKRGIPVSIYRPILEPWTELFRTTRILDRIKDDGTDLIHVQTPYLVDLGARLAGKLKCPYLFTFPHVKTLQKRLKVRHKWMRGVITLTESAREHLVNETHIPKEMIRVIYAGVNLEDMKESSSGNNANHKTVVGVTGPLEEWRGHRYFLEAAQGILSQNAQVQFLIIGEGPLEDKLREQSRSLGINKSIVFMATLTDYYAVLPKVDIFVFPLLQMGMGMTILQAMGCGKPVITSARGDIYQLIKEDETGFLIPPHDVRAIKDKVFDLIDNRILMREVGMRARQFVKANFPPVRMTEQTVQFYHDICAAELPHK